MNYDEENTSSKNITSLLIEENVAAQITVNEDCFAISTYLITKIIFINFNLQGIKSN